MIDARESGNETLTSSANGQNGPKRMRLDETWVFGWIQATLRMYSDHEASKSVLKSYYTHLFDLLDIVAWEPSSPYTTFFTRACNLSIPPPFLILAPDPDDLARLEAEIHVTSRPCCR